MSHLSDFMLRGRSVKRSVKMNSTQVSESTRVRELPSHVPEQENALAWVYWKTAKQQRIVRRNNRGLELQSNSVSSSVQSQCQKLLTHSDMLEYKKGRSLGRSRRFKSIWPPKSSREPDCWQKLGSLKNRNSPKLSVMERKDRPRAGIRKHKSSRGLTGQDTLIPK